MGCIITTVIAEFSFRASGMKISATSRASGVRAQARQFQNRLSAEVADIAVGDSAMTVNGVGSFRSGVQPPTGAYLIPAIKNHPHRHHPRPVRSAIRQRRVPSVALLRPLPNLATRLRIRPKHLPRRRHNPNLRQTVARKTPHRIPAFFLVPASVRPLRAFIDVRCASRPRVSASGAVASVRPVVPRSAVAFPLRIFASVPAPIIHACASVRPVVPRPPVGANPLRRFASVPAPVVHAVAGVRPASRPAVLAGGANRIRPDAVFANLIRLARRPDVFRRAFVNVLAHRIRVRPARALFVAAVARAPVTSDGVFASRVASASMRSRSAFVHVRESRADFQVRVRRRDAFLVVAVRVSAGVLRIASRPPRNIKTVVRIGGECYRRPVRNRPAVCHHRPARPRKQRPVDDKRNRHRPVGRARCFVGARDPVACHARSARFRIFPVLAGHALRIGRRPVRLLPRRTLRNASPRIRCQNRRGNAVAALQVGVGHKQVRVGASPRPARVSTVAFVAASRVPGSRHRATLLGDRKAPGVFADAVGEMGAGLTNVQAAPGVGTEKSRARAPAVKRVQNLMASRFSVRGRAVSALQCRGSGRQGAGLICGVVDGGNARTRLGAFGLVVVGFRDIESESGDACDEDGGAHPDGGPDNGGDGVDDGGGGSHGRDCITIPPGCQISPEN